MTIHQQGESIQDLKLIQVHLSFYPKDHAFSKVRSGQVRSEIQQCGQSVKGAQIRILD